MSAPNRMMSLNVFSNYAKEIEKHWKYKETQRNKFLFSSPQLTLRIHLVEWLKSVSEKLKVSYRTIHLAIYILDMFMDKHSITQDRLGFVALVCLMLAAKFEELDTKIPKISELNKYDGDRYSHRDFIAVEVMILKFLDFGLTQPTIAHFAEYYAMFAVLPCDNKASTVSLHRLGEIACSIVAEFLDISLKEVKLLKYRPSQVAAACIMATRMRMDLSPRWTDVLEELTGYHEEILKNCVSLLFSKLHHESGCHKKCVHSPDHGYISGTS